MAENPLAGKNSSPSATGPAGPIPHRDYCKPQCYKGARATAEFCQCKGCLGDAHGRGWNYAFEHGYLKYLPPGFQKTPPDQQELFPEELATAIGSADHTH